MSRVLLLVEGQTERAIAETVLAPYLAERGVWLYPRYRKGSGINAHA